MTFQRTPLRYAAELLVLAPWEIIMNDRQYALIIIDMQNDFVLPGAPADCNTLDDFLKVF
jgi:hypothetical protein